MMQALQTLLAKCARLLVQEAGIVRQTFKMPVSPACSRAAEAALNIHPKVACLCCSKVTGFIMMRAAAQLQTNSVRRPCAQGCTATDWALPVGILDDASCVSCTAPSFHAFQSVNFQIPAASQSEAPKQMVPRPFVRLAATSSLSTRVTSLHPIRQSRPTRRDLLPCCSKTAVASRCSERCGFLSTDQAQLRLNMHVLDCEATVYFQHFIQWLSARPGCAGCACQGVMDIGSFASVVARLSPTTRGRACATDVRQQ